MSLCQRTVGTVESASTVETVGDRSLTSTEISSAERSELIATYFDSIRENHLKTSKRFLSMSEVI